MSFVRVKGFKIFADRHGKMRCYHRKTGVPVDLEKAPLGSAEFFAECARIVPAQQAGPKAGTLGGLITKYRASSRFTDLAPRTRADYEVSLTYLKPIGDALLVRFDRHMVVQIRDKAEKAHGWHYANRLKAVMSVMFKWAAEQGHIAQSPATEIRSLPRPKALPVVHRRWTDDERETVLAAVTPHMKPAIGLMMFCGLGPKDALTMTRSAVNNGEIVTRRSKTGEPVFWHMPSPLAEILAQAPRHDAVTLAVSSTGRPWTLTGFNTVWFRIRARLEAEGKIGPDLTLYGLRHSCAELLAELGFDPRTIADALGQKTEAMARHYAKGANLRKKMAEVGAAADAEWAKRRTEVVKPRDMECQTDMDGTNGDKKE